MMSAQNLRQQLNGSKLAISILMLMVLLVACGGEDGDKKDATVAPSPSVSTTSQSPQLRVLVEKAAVFEFPNRNAEAFFTLLQGEVLPISGKSYPDELGTVFYRVAIGEQIGWVAASQVEVQGDIEALVVIDIPNYIMTPEAATAIAQQANATIDYRVVLRVIVEAGSFLDKPDADAKPIYAVVAGDEFVASHKTPLMADNLLYYGVELRNGTGWIRSDMVEVSGSTSALVVVVSSTPHPTHTPTLTIETIPSTPTATLTHTIQVEQGNLPSPTITTFPQGDILTATLSPIPSSTLTPSMTSTPANTASPTPRSIQEIEPPPLRLTLLEGWEEGHFMIPTVSALSVAQYVGLSLYEGPLPEGLKGSITIIWNFPTIIPSANAEADLWPDTILYLREMLFNGCNIGIDIEGRSNYALDGHEAISSTYQAVDCGGGISDIAGRFIGVEAEGLNYAIYLGIEPIESVSLGLVYLENIVATLEFLPRNQ